MKEKLKIQKKYKNPMKKEQNKRKLSQFRFKKGRVILQRFKEKVIVN